MTRNRLCALFLVFVLALGPLASPQPASSFTIDNIMRGAELFGYPQTAIRWSPDSQRIYFQWKKYDEPREKNVDTYVVNADNTGLHKLTEDEAKDAPPVQGDWTKDKKRAVYADAGDLYIYDASQAHRRRLTHTIDVESNPRFTRDETHITFQRSGNLYRLSLTDATLDEPPTSRPEQQPARRPPQQPVVDAEDVAAVAHRPWQAVAEPAASSAAPTARNF